MPLQACLCAVSVSALLGSSGSEDKRKQHEDGRYGTVPSCHTRGTIRKTGLLPRPEVPQSEEYMTARWSVCLPMYPFKKYLDVAQKGHHQLLRRPTDQQTHIYDILQDLLLLRQSRHRETIAF
ncbi:hypothetical protein LX36DRAFT_675231 [Colletotrichum falcatum]|nr:hypothetical protein LX36DRAFT_675231 [Colletotrichum falcatum]